MRLIDANALLESGICTEYGYNDNGLLLIPMRDVTNSIQNAPTIDAVPVVRCRECKHCDPENYHCDHPMGTAAPLKRKPDDFCSYGERMDGDSNAKAD